MERTVRYGKGRAGRQSGGVASAEKDDQSQLHEERERLIHERQEAVARVLDRHDDLVSIKISNTSEAR